MCEEGLVGVGGKEGGKRKRRMGGSSQEQSCEKSPHTAKKKKAEGGQMSRLLAVGLESPHWHKVPIFCKLFTNLPFRGVKFVPP